MKLKIKKLRPNAVMPSRAYPGDAGWDLTACMFELYGEVRKTRTKSEEPAYAKAFFGIAVEIPAGHVGLIFPRSSIHKQAFRLSNAVGVIDSGYRGELMAVFDALPFREIDGEPVTEGYDCQKPCAQLVILPLPEVELEEVDELSSSERGTGGFGSSDERRKTYGK